MILIIGDKAEKHSNSGTNKGRMSQAFPLCQMRSLIYASTAQYLSCSLSGAFLGDTASTVWRLEGARLRCRALGSAEGLLPTLHLAWSYMTEL